MPEPLTGKYAGIVWGGVEYTEFYARKFQARHAVMLHAINKGWTLADCRTHFLNNRIPGSSLWLEGDDGRELPPGEGLRRLTADYRDMAAYASRNPAFAHAIEVRQEIDAVLEPGVRDFPWKGRAGRTDRDVLTGTLGRMHKVGSLEIDISVREAALRGGVTYRTASTSLGRLVDDGWLKKTPAEVTGHADSYKSLIADRLTRHRDRADETPDDARALGAASEVWVRLGKATMDIYSVLTDQPLSGREISRRSRVSVGSVSQNLPRLKFYGLAVKEGNGWVIGPVAPGEVVIDHEWTGDNSKTFQRQERYARDRLAFHGRTEVPAPSGASPF